MARTIGSPCFSCFLLLFLSFFLVCNKPTPFSFLFYTFLASIFLNSISSLFQFSAIQPAEIVCRAPVVPPTPPLSPYYMFFFSAVSFVDFQELYLDSWLLSFGCLLSILYGYSREADWSWMWHLVRCCLAAEGYWDGSGRSFAAAKTVEVSGCCVCAF